ncbi:MAG: carboxypeptidase regulatory-like domain-containing protein [bacterium]
MFCTMPNIRLAAFLLVSASCAALAQAPVAGYRVAGFVDDGSGKPVPNAAVTLISAAEQRHAFRTDSTGRFVFLDIPAGRIGLEVRRVGYAPFLEGVNVHETSAPDSFRVVLKPFALPGIEITADSGGAPAEYYARKSANHFGRFLDGDVLMKSDSRLLSDALRMVPGVTMTPSRTGNRLRIRGCRPTIWVNGVRAALAEVDDVGLIDDIAGMEIYNSTAGLPPQYVDLTNHCGALLIWSK